MAKVGRPPKMTPDTLRKLEEVFAIGGSDSEACFYADICKETLYAYQREHPEFVDRKEALKEKPILKARQAVVKGLDNYSNAMDYLKRKRKKEFGDSHDITSGGEKINNYTDEQISAIASRIKCNGGTPSQKKPD